MTVKLTQQNESGLGGERRPLVRQASAPTVAEKNRSASALLKVLALTVKLTQQNESGLGAEISWAN